MMIGFSVHKNEQIQYNRVFYALISTAIGLCQVCLWQSLVLHFWQNGWGIAPFHRVNILRLQISECGAVELFMSIPADQDSWSHMGMWF